MESRTRRQQLIFHQSSIQQEKTMHDNIFEIFKRRYEAFYNDEFFRMYSAAIPLKAECSVTKEPVPFKDRLKLKYTPVKKGDVWGHEWESAWFHLTATVPKDFADKELCIRLNTGGESLVFDASGNPLCGLTSESVFDMEYFKERYVLGKYKAGDKIDLWVESAATHLFGINQPKAHEKDPEKPEGEYSAQVRVMELCVFDREMFGLVMDFNVLYSLLQTYDKKSYRARQLLIALNKTLEIYNYDPVNAPEARKYLKEHVYNCHAVDSAMHACCIGHAHIDVGWLWPVCETIRKTARTFSSQLGLLEQYPDFIFGASQAELYRMMKDHYPALYKKIKKRVAEGRWEIQGGMWVETDCNIISGESMIRQILHGKNFFMDEFGIDVRTIWIPDVFGYSASMPQIMLKSGCDYFLTQKISWNQINTFPYSSFRWIGIDGSEVLTHFPPENTYNARCVPLERKDATDNYQEGGISNEFMSLLGIGNGGGGPSEDYLERNERVKNLEGCPTASYGTSLGFFERLNKVRKDLPSWDGELYLEMHRGTLTTQSRTKRNNRKCEQALAQLEALASCLPPAHYPRKKLDEAWKTVLVNQFHDIIPGSSIGLVYKTTEKQHADILKMCKDECMRAARKLFKADPDSAVVANTLSTPWYGIIELPADWKNVEILDENGKICPVQLENGKILAYVQVDGLTFKTLRKGKNKATPVATRARSKTKLILENDIIRYTFNEKGQVISAIDLKNGREYLTAPGNVMSIYNDRPHTYEAWDVDHYYPQDKKGEIPCIKAEAALTGPARSTLSFTYKTEKSTVTQTVSLTPGSARLDFITHADWHESRMMLRTAFPAAVRASEATFDIQYGFVKRPTHDNTSWDQAKFEVVGQRYADLSEDDHGVALLNDCKYGYRMKGSTLDLNLLRSPKWPDYNADQGEHDFTYSFYPHTGNHIEGGVLQEAAILNLTPFIAPGFRAEKTVFPCRTTSSQINIEVLKRAEKDNSRIVRLVERTGRHNTVKLNINRDVKRVSETNLMEWEQGRDIKVNKGAVSLELKPFEIVTLRLD